MTDGPEHWRRVTELFDALVGLPGEEQQARLAELPETDTPLRREIESLLDAARDVGDRFDRAPLLPETLPSPSLVERRVGPYLITREIGRGGMGTVYEAHRADDQYAKRVAIKTVTSANDRVEMQRRFQRERQLLARLEHRNIAALLDGGVTAEGLPYFIMEFVEGQPITVWCDARGLDVRERLALFRQVCGAVQYAHEHLVVHRDLKPGNILVSGDGTVKLLDFGIAKLVDPTSLGDETLTRTGALPMTAAYASPEQLRGEPVSTASDIYSLGVVLYELVAGQRPFGNEGGLLSAVHAAATRTAPEPPSTAVRTTPGDTIAERRRRALRGDVDSIVMMALRSEPSRRYRSAQQFADDLQRHLDGQPILAQPDTFGYRFAKFVRRNRAATSAGALAVAALLTGTVVSVRQARAARAERDRALVEQQRTEQVKQFFQNILSSGKPQDGGKALTVVEAIDRAIPTIDTAFAANPDLRAAIKNTLASVLSDMYLYDRSKVLLVDALPALRQAAAGRPTREYADALYNLAGAENGLGEIERAESLYRASLTMYGKVPGVDSVEIYRGLNNLAGAIFDQGRLQEAADLWAKVGDRLLVLSPKDSVTQAIAMTNRGVALSTLGRYAEAEPMLRRAAMIFERTRGHDDLRVAEALQPLAGTLMFQGKYAEAETAARRALAIDAAVHGAHNPQTFVAQRMLVNVLAEAGRCAAAIPLADEMIAQRGATLGEKDPSLGTAYLFKGWCQAQTGDAAHGEATTREGLRLRTAGFPAGHWAIAQGESMLGDVLARLGPARHAEAERRLRSGYEGMRKTLDSTNVRVLQAKTRLERFTRG